MAEDTNDSGGIFKYDDNDDQSPNREEEIIVAADERGRIAERNARVEDSEEQIPMSIIQQGSTSSSPTSMTYNRTVRVQVPDEELLPGNKMIVNVSGRQNHHLPLEVVVPPNIEQEPGTIISVQVPTVEEKEEEMTRMMMMLHPDPQPVDQYHQQQQQQKEKEKRQVPPTIPVSTFPYTTSEQSNNDAMKHSDTDQKGEANGLPEQITNANRQARDSAQDVQIEKEGNMVPDRKRELPTTCTTTLLSTDSTTSSIISKRQKTHCTSTKERKWDQQFQEWQRYIAQYGDVIVKEEHRQEYDVLHQWIYQQRSAFHSHQLELDRFDQLNNSGFQWVCGSTPHKVAAGAAAMAVITQRRKKKMLEMEQECPNKRENTNADSNRESSTERDKQKNRVTCTTTTTTTMDYVCPDCHQRFPSKCGYEYHIDNCVCLIQRQRAVCRAATTAAEQEQAAEELQKMQATSEEQVQKRKREKKETKEKQGVNLQTKWQLRLRELKEYARQHEGCTHIPAKYGPNQPLASWVVTQKSEYKKFKDVHNTKKCSMTLARIAELNQIQFQWQGRRHKKTTESGGGDAHKEESKRKISWANAGKKPWNTGKTRSEAEKAKISAGVHAQNRAKLRAKLERLGMTEVAYGQKQKEIKYAREKIRRHKLKKSSRHRRSNNNGEGDEEQSLVVVSEEIQLENFHWEVLHISTGRTFTPFDDMLIYDDRISHSELTKSEWMVDFFHRTEKIVNNGKWKLLPSNIRTCTSEPNHEGKVTPEQIIIRWQSMKRQSKSLVEIWTQECRKDIYSSPWSKMSNQRTEKKKKVQSKENIADLQQQLQELVNSIHDPDVVIEV